MHARNRTWPLGSDPAERCRQRTMPVEGGDGSTLSLDFTSGVIDPRLTFTRTTNATFINSSGLVEWAGANAMTQSNDFSVSPWAVSNVSVSIDGTSPVGNAWKILENSANDVHRLNPGGISSGIPGTGVPVSISIHVKQGSGSRQAYMLISDNGTGDVRSKRLDPVTGTLVGTESSGGSWSNASTSVQNLGNGWYRLTLTATRGGGSALICRTGLSDSSGNLTYQGDGTSFLYFSGHQINPGSTAQQYYATTGSAYHAPRFDYDPTTIGSPRGLLIEGSAVNLALRSNDFNTTLTDGTQWTVSGYTGTATSTTLPDGTTGNTLRISTASGSGSVRSSTLTVSPNTAYTWSFWARNNSGSQARWRVWNVTGGSSIVDYTQSANNYVSQIGGANNTSSTWVRVSVTFTTPAGCTSIWVYPASSDSGTVDLFVWGAQVELGSGASSYIPTGSSTGNRAADVCTMSNITSLNYNANGGTLFAHFSNNTENANFAGSIAFNNGANYAQRIRWGSGALLASYYQTNGTTALGSNLSGNRTSFAAAKVATSYSFDGTMTSTAMSINGAQASTTPTSSAVAGVSIATALALNSDNSNAATAYPSIAVRSVKFYPTALTMAQMNAITANP